MVEEVQLEFIIFFNKILLPDPQHLHPLTKKKDIADENAPTTAEVSQVKQLQLAWMDMIQEKQKLKEDQ
jgi:hypothetical protein